MNSWTMPILFTIKVLAGFLFLFVYTYIYGNGSLGEDAGVFIRESKMVNAVFWESPLSYFKLLLNIGDQREIVELYLQDTYRWDSGPMGITSDNRNMLRIHSLIHFISFNIPSVHLMFMAFISAIGIKQLFISIRNNCLLNEYFVLAVLVMLPNALFWSSGILKEPFMLLGIGLITRAFMDESTLRKKIILALLGALILFLFKPFVLLAIIPVVMLLVIYRSMNKRKIVGTLSVFLLLLISSILLFPQQKKDVLHMISRKQFDFNNVGKGGVHAMIDTNYFYVSPEHVGLLEINGDSVRVVQKTSGWKLRQGRMDVPVSVELQPSKTKWFIFDNRERSSGYFDVTLINDSFTQLMYNIPEAIINCLFRPFITDPVGPIKYLANLETLFVFGFLFFALFRRKKMNPILKERIFIIFAFLIISCLIIGWVTPVSGAIIRYRIPVYYAITFISMLLINSQKKVVDTDQ